MRVLLAYDCDTGLLIYLWSPTCCYGVMTDYRKFHNKMVAYATKDDPINIRIDTLKDLDSPDESVFAISQPTPVGKRIVTENLSETQVRTFLVNKMEVQWPHVSKNPPEKTMAVNIVRSEFRLASFGAFALLNSTAGWQNRGLRTTLALRKQFEFGKTTSTTIAAPEKLTA